MTRRPPRVMISAGEASGDRLGAGLAAALRRRRPDIELFGMGGPCMAEQGVERVQDSAEVAVVGILEVLAHFTAIRAAMRRLEHVLDERRPDLLVPVDFPDFNLRLAARARRRGIDVVYLVSPQVWAWRRRRVQRIRSLVRRMLVLFPFEVGFYRDAGVPVTFVGHPVAEQAEVGDRDGFLRRAGLADDERPRIALLPGSRVSEIGRLLDVQLSAAGILVERPVPPRFLLPMAPGLDRSAIDAAVRQRGLGDHVQVHAGEFRDLLAACDAGVVASGTASLEAAVAGLPIVVVYRMHPLTYAMGRMLVRIDDIALPNLVAGRRIVPELVQGECTPERVAAELARYLDEPSHAAAVRGELAEVRKKLGGPGIYERAADGVMEELGRVAPAGDLS